MFENALFSYLFLFKGVNRPFVFGLRASRREALLILRFYAAGAKTSTSFIQTKELPMGRTVITNLM